MQKKKPKTPKAKKAKLPPTVAKIAQFIVTKYVEKHRINWPRDMKVALEWAKLYPEIEFWKILPCDFQVEGLFILNTEPAARFRFNQWNIFHLDIPKQSQYSLESEKVGDSYAPSSKNKKPTSIHEFCK